MKQAKRSPQHLEKAGRAFWRAVLSEYVLEDAHHLQMLAAAAECLDRMATARAEIDREGAYFTDRFGQPKEHPAHKTERDNKVLFCRIVRELNLDLEAPPDNRPPRLAG